MFRLVSLRRMWTGSKLSASQDQRRPRKDKKKSFLAAARPQLEQLESRLAPTVSIVSNFAGLAGGEPPDTCGAAGPSSYIETINSSVRIFNKSTGAAIASDTLSHFLFTTGGITPFPDSLADATMAYDEVTGQFIVGDMDIAWESNPNDSRSALDIAVSKTSNPTALDAANWNFYQIVTTEANTEADYPGNMGYNADAFVFTYNMLGINGVSNHTQVVALSQSSIAAGGNIGGLRFDLNNHFSTRPVTMHDSSAGGPMWFVEESSGPSSNPTLNIVRINNILTAPAVTSFNRGVNAYGAVNPPLNPDGTRIIAPGDGQADSRILKAAEANNIIVASQTVGVGTTEDDARWYEIRVSDVNNPVVFNQGNYGFGNHTYTVYPAIDINPVGDIGLAFSKSGTDTSTDFVHADVTGMNASDGGVMEGTAIVLADGNSNLCCRMGDFSGINVDPNGTFWTAQEMTRGGAATQIANWTMSNGGEAFVKNGVVWVTGTNADDHFTLQRVTISGLQFTQVVDNGVVLGNFLNGTFSSINVFGFGGNDSVNIDSPAAPTTINDGDGNNVVNIERLSARTPVSVHPGRGNDTINLSPVARNLNNLALTSPVTISGGTGRNSLNIFDDNFNGDRDGVVFSNEFDYGSPFLSTVVSYDSAVTNLLVSAGSASTVTVRGTAATTNIDRAVRVNVGDFFDGVQDIRGPVRIQNTATSQTTLRVDDSANRAAVPDARQITNSPVAGFHTLHGLAPADISYRGSQTPFVNITLGSGPNTFTFENTNTASAAINTTLTGGPGNNTVNVLRTTSPLTINGGTGQNNVNVGSTDNKLDAIQGALTVNGGTGNARLTFNDQGTSSANLVYLVTDTSVSRGGFSPLVNYSHISNLVVNAGNGSNDEIAIIASSAGTAVTINAGTGNDFVHAGGSVIGNLGQIQGPVTVNGQGGNTRLTLFDQSTTTPKEYDVFANVVKRVLNPGPPRTYDAVINYANIQTLSLNAGAGDDIFMVNGTAPGATTTLNGGDGNDAFVVGDGVGLDGIAGRLRLDGQGGGGGGGFARVNDTVGTNARTYTWDGSSLRWGDVTVEVANLGLVQLISGQGNDAFIVSALGTIPLALGDAGGVDSLTGPDAATTWTITGADAGNLGPAATFTGVENLVGGSGDDVFVFADGAGVSGAIAGGAGTNTLDYSAYATGVYVNLQTGIATGVAGGIANIQNVTGSQGDNILVGNGNRNVLTVYGGHNLVIAGGGAGTLNGGTGLNLLIGGTTNYDTEDASLRAILQFWESVTPDNYNDGVNSLLAGNGVPALNTDTVHSNGAGNQFTGGSLNLYFGSLTLDSFDTDPPNGRVIEI